MANCKTGFIGKVPLCDGDGLYGYGSNEHPYLKEGIEAGKKIRRLDRDGYPSDNGKVGFLAFGGMSNARQEFARFIKDARPVASRVISFYNGNRGSWDASRIANSGNEYWDWLLKKIEASNLSTKQVQVAWIKNSVRLQVQPYPHNADELAKYLDVIYQKGVSLFPNLRQVFFSSAIYSGYSVSPARREPTAYDEGFGVRKVVLQYSHDAPVWASWAAYLWADGIRPRSDGLDWQCSDFEADGVHPATSAESKVSNLLVRFFQTNPATVWFTGLI